MSSPVSPVRINPRAQRTRDAIIDTMILLADEGALERSSMQVIAARAGVAYASLFRHFGSREALIDGALDALVQRARAALASHLQASPADSAKRIFNFVAGYENLCRLLLQSDLAPSRHALVERILTSVETPANVNDGLPPGLARHHIIAATVDILDWWLRQPVRPSAEAMGDAYIRLVLQPVGEQAAAAIWL